MTNSSQNNWLSHILRPRASSVSVESCLNLATSDPSSPLDARPVLPLLENSQPLSSRCKHLATFSEICKSYKFTHLENVFFTVQDILEPTMPREARHGVFQFMLACIVGQYAELGMARVTFYSSLRNYNNWEDFSDMYNVLYALCKEGRDISGFEKNICKLLIHWLDVSIKQRKEPIPHLADILHLLTLVAKFNFALFEEMEVTDMIRATHKAFFSSNHANDRKACLDFTDIVVRYRFVPFDALHLFLDILASSVILLPNHSVSSWPIFLNLLRSHCAHNAILTLCHFLDKEPSKIDTKNIQIKGAITLLGETAWGQTNKAGADAYMVTDSVILLYLKRAATRGNDTINGTILKTLNLLVANDTTNTLGMMEWDAVWDIMDVCTQHILKITDNNSNNDVHLFDTRACESYPTTSCIYQFCQLSQVMIEHCHKKTLKGPMIRWIQVLYRLRAYCNETTARILLDYYVTEHSLLPSTEDWLTTLKEITNTFFIHSTLISVRLLMLSIVTDVCTAVKDFYSELTYETIVIPMMQKLPLETDTTLLQSAIDLIVSSLSDCQNDDIFDTLLSILRECAQCKCVIIEETPITRGSSMRISHTPHSQQVHRSAPPTPAIQHTKTFVTDTREEFGGHCKGVSAMCGITELFENLLLASNGKLCVKTFNTITEIAIDKTDMSCPYGGPKIVALDLLLRFRCPTNHHIYLVNNSKTL